MLNASFVLIILLIYIFVLFLVALSVENNSKLSAIVSKNPYIYSLSLAVYCTSWTYYGSIGKAVTSGLMFLTIYIGPTIAIILWWLVLRKMVRIKNKFRITSIADFISARYDRSSSIAALITVGALIGTMPYIALQLKAVITTFNLVSMESDAGSIVIRDNIDTIVVFLLTLFTIVFGVRRIDPTERHQGMVTAVAVQSIVKLVAFLACGLFVVYVLHDGYGELTGTFLARESTMANLMNLGGSTFSSYSSYSVWSTYLVLAMSAIVFLPRQFHVSVVENSDEKHILTAMWVFPLYMLLINIFVMAIAMEGLLAGIPVDQADYYVLQLPILHGRPVLPLLVFIGGVSAATGMVMITAMTLATMISNHIVLPVVDRLSVLGFLRSRLLPIRWAAVALVMLTAWWFEHNVGESYMLVNMGMISFAAVLQFAPASLGGMFWRKGNKAGALLGIGAGFAIWFYTLLLPSFIKSGWLDSDLLTNGPWGISLLKPEGLMGLLGLDPLTHTFFWSLFANICLYVLGSLYFSQTASEQRLANAYVDALRLGTGENLGSRGKAEVALAHKVDKITALFERYISPDKSRGRVQECLRESGLEGKTVITLPELAALVAEAESSLAGVLGSAHAHQAIEAMDLYTDEETDALADFYVDLLADLKLSPAELSRKINYYQEREALLARNAEDLERRVEERTAELEAANKELEEFSYSVSHDLRAPLRSIDGFSQALLEDYGDAIDEEGLNYLTKVRRASQRMGVLIDDLLRLGRVTRKELDRQRIDLSAMMREVVESLQEHDPERKPEIVIEDGMDINADPSLTRILLDNLIGNAWKFTARKDDARIEMGRTDIDHGSSFYIRDNGVGFDMTYAHKLFKAFSRLHSMDEFKGTGIGLAIVQQVVKRHGGDVWAESREGEGTFFYFTLQPRISNDE